MGLIGKEGEMGGWVLGGGVVACWWSALSQRAPGGHCPFVKQPVTSTAFTVDPAGIYVLI